MVFVAHNFVQDKQSRREIEISPIEGRTPSVRTSTFCHPKHEQISPFHLISSLRYVHGLSHYFMGDLIDFKISWLLTSILWETSWILKS